jgi:hypothetical protein
LGNYAIGYVDGSLTVNTKPLTITATDQSKTYGDTFTPVGTSQFTTGGLVNGDSVTSVTLASNGYVDTATVAAPGPDYVITPSVANGSGLDNYSISYSTGNLHVNKAVLTVTPNPMSVDEGTVPSGLTASYGVFKFVGENAGNIGLTGTPGFTGIPTDGTSAPGPYTITANVSALTADNYSFTGATGTLTVVDVAPVIAMSTGTIALNLGDGFTRPGSFSDVGYVVPSETWTLTVDYGDGTVQGPTSMTRPNTSTAITSVGHVYATIGTRTVTVTISDNYGAYSTKTFTVNVAP